MELFKNNAKSTLASGISAGAGTLTVRSGEGARFPSPSGGNFFWLTLQKSSGIKEIVKVTARAGDVLTILRAQQGTAASTFSAGDDAQHRLTAKTLEDLRDSGGGGGGGSVRGFTQADIDALAWTNQGSSTLTKDPSADLAVLLLTSGDSANEMRLATKAIPAFAGNWRYRAKLWMAGPDTPRNASGICVRESSSGKLIAIQLNRWESAPTTGIRIWKFTDATTFSSEPYSVSLTDFNGWMLPILFEIQRSSGTLHFRWNRGEGGAALEAFSEAVGTFFDSEPDEIGIVGYRSVAADCYSTFEYLEKVS